MSRSPDIAPSSCTTCEKPLGPKNRTGLCLPCFNRSRAGDPEHRAKVSAGLKYALAHDPVMKEASRARVLALRDLPQTKAAKRKRWMAEKPWIKGNEVQGKGSEARQRAARNMAATKLGDIPPHLRDEYRRLTRVKHYSAAEAREIMAQQHELEMARWRRQNGIVEPEVEPTATERRQAIEITAFMPLTDRAIALVCNATGMSRDEILSESRQRPVVRARWVVYNVLRAAGRSYPTIARMLKRKDHSPILHALRETKIWARQDPAFGALLDDVMGQCRPHIEAAKAAAMDEAA